MEIYTSTAARSAFADMMADAQHGVVQITQHNEPTTAVMSWEIYESLLETLEILSDETLMAKILRGEKQIKAGRTSDWEDVKRSMKL